MPITAGDSRYNYFSSTGWINRYNDAYILSSKLSGGTPVGSSTTVNKLFPLTIYYSNSILLLPNGTQTGNTFRLAVTEDPSNPRNITTLNSQGFTLFIKKGLDGNDTVCGNLRTTSGNATAVTGNSWGFTFARGNALTIGLGVTGSGAGTAGLTGNYIFYIVNHEPQNADELVWRVQYSFGGTGNPNNAYTQTTPQNWDPHDAWLDIINPTGNTYFTNRDGCGHSYNQTADQTGEESRPVSIEYNP